MQEESKKELNEDQIRDLCVKIFTDINREVDSGVLEEKHKILDIIENEDFGMQEMVYYLNLNMNIIHIMDLIWMI